jgi:hypothetical protein
MKKQLISFSIMLDIRTPKSLSEIAREMALTRTRVTQIVNPLRLPFEIRAFLLELNDIEKIRKYTVPRLRHIG